jgi:hypothetical protein
MGEKLESCGARKKRKGLFDANEAFADIVEGMECVNVAKARVMVLSHRVDKQVEGVALQGGHMTLVCTIVIPINWNPTAAGGQWWSSACVEVLWLELCAGLEGEGLVAGRYRRFSPTRSGRCALPASVIKVCVSWACVS